MTEEQEKIIAELNQFIGTEHYYKISLGNLIVTDGFKYFCERLKCFWLSDICSSVQNLKDIKENVSFIVWKIKVNEDKSFIVRAYSDYDCTKEEDFNKKYLLYEQKGNYTDFKLNEYDFYQCEEVLMLKNEY